MRAGNEIGLHGSLGTGSDAARFTEERNRLARRVDRRPSGVRQHFLRLRPGRTHLAMQQAGFQYDATCGFADRNGFRLGVADVVKAWLGNSQSELDTVPLTWMDRAASKYQGVEDPALLISEGVELARTCRDVEGLWVGLWHPNLVPALGFPGAPAAFRDLMHQVAGDGPYFSTLERLVSWRRARRAIRARQIAPDGRMDLISTHQSDWVIPIEDGQGRVLEPHPSMVLDA